MNKDEHRQQQSNYILYTVMFLVVAVVLMGFMGKVTSEFNFALGAILGYAGNHTVQNYRTKPSEDVS